MEITALCSQSKNRKSFYTKVFPFFKNGQKKCPKTKTQNTFVQKICKSVFAVSLFSKNLKILVCYHKFKSVL